MFELEQLETRTMLSGSGASLHVAGDLNKDGRLNGADAAIMLTYLNGQEKITPAIVRKADCTGDGKFTFADFSKAFRLIILPPPVTQL